MQVNTLQCPNCGGNVQYGNKYCQYCGVAIEFVNEDDDLSFVEDIEALDAQFKNWINNEVPAQKVVIRIQREDVEKIKEDNARKLIAERGLGKLDIEPVRRWPREDDTPGQSMAFHSIPFNMEWDTFIKKWVDRSPYISDEEISNKFFEGEPVPGENTISRARNEGFKNRIREILNREGRGKWSGDDPFVREIAVDLYSKMLNGMLARKPGDPASPVTVVHEPETWKPWPEDDKKQIIENIIHDAISKGFRDKYFGKRIVSRLSIPRDKDVLEFNGGTYVVPAVFSRIRLDHDEIRGKESGQEKLRVLCEKYVEAVEERHAQLVAREGPCLVVHGSSGLNIMFQPHDLWHTDVVLQERMVLIPHPDGQCTDAGNPTGKWSTRTTGDILYNVEIDFRALLEKLGEPGMVHPVTCYLTHPLYMFLKTTYRMPGGERSILRVIKEDFLNGGEIYPDKTIQSTPATTYNNTVVLQAGNRMSWMDNIPANE